MIRRFGLALFFLHVALLPSALGGDWVHWRGPEENGYSREKNLPDSFDPKQGPKGNVLWQQPYGGRSAPLVMDGRLYINQGFGEGYEEAERVLCFDEMTGKLLWEHRYGVYHTDIVSSRLGWTSMAGDPATGYVYNHATSGALFCLDKTGKVVWQRQLTEEFGRVSGYGGRIVSPIFDSGMVIIGMINASWGDQTRGANRFLALDGKTGEVVWWSAPGGAGKPLTYQSNPIVTVIGGQRLLITGGAEGGLIAMKVRTGEVVWNSQFSIGAINPSPVVDGNLVFCGHGEENPEGGSIGRVFCVDASQIDPQTHQPKLVWEFRKANRFGLSSPAIAEGRLYIPDDTGELFCFRAKDGKLLWSYRYGTEVRGAPLVADGKVYIFDVKGRMVIMTLKGDEKPDRDETFEYKFRDPKGLLNETNGTPIAVNGHVYFMTKSDLYCIGDPKAKAECGKYKSLAEETKYDPTAAPAALRIFPAETINHAGQKLNFKLLMLDANGREVKPTNMPAVQWSTPASTTPAPKTTDPKAPAPKGPPPLQAKVLGDASGAVVELATLPPTQQGYLQAEVAGLKAVSRVRVAATIPYKQDFTNIPEGASPGGWNNTQGKYVVVQLPDGNKVLSKTNNIGPPPVVRANAYITTPDSAGYTIQSDLMAVMVRGKIPDMGVVACRYTLVLDGKTDPETNKRTLRLTSWEARPRVDIRIDLDWEPSVWYQAKLTVVDKGKTALVRGKVWKKGEPEPEKWTIEFEDPTPNLQGAAALYGYVSNATATEPGASIYYDNVVITPNAK